MTSASIMEMQKVGVVAQTNTTKATAETPSVQFSDAMQFASAGQQESEVETLQETEVKTHAEKSAAEHTGRKEIREAEKTESKADVSEEEISDEMESKEEAVVKEIAETLGVSEEEVREAMEVLGLGVMDLISQGNMVALTAQLTGMQNVDVLTDENLFAQITELTQSVQNELQAAADSLGISLEQLQEAIEEQMPGEEASMVQVAEMPAEQPVAEEVQKVAQAITSEEMETVDELPKEKTEVTEAEVVKEEVTINKEMADAEQSPLSGESDKNSGHEPTLAQQGQNVQAIRPDANMVTEIRQEEMFGSRMDIEQTRELIHQIADYVRLNRTETISSMEIQLHPVELGTVDLQVVAKDGNISARLAVQDEAVRAALESQVAQLRESLQAQGLKIDAVEVTVATHEFEQNLDQHGKDAEENAAKEKKNGRRILDLNEIGTEELDGEEMSEADRLQVEMMRMGGNRLNLRV